MSARFDAWLGVLAAIVGTLPGTVLAGVCLARFSPLAEDARFALGFTATIPLWIAAMCFAFLARSGARAWAACLGAAALLACFVYGVPR